MNSLSRNLLFAFLAFCAAAAGRARADDAPKVTLERIVDGRGHRVCDVARAELEAEGVRRTAWVVRGLVRSDLVFSRETGPGGTTDAIGLDDRPALRFASPSPGGRVTATSRASSFRYFDVDLSRKTVRCNLLRLADETDPDLLAAAGEYGLLKQGLENGGSYAPEESPVVALLAARKQPLHPSPPYRKRVPLPESEPETAALTTAARAALSR